jgi:hypothetical protein
MTKTSHFSSVWPVSLTIDPLGTLSTNPNSLVYGETIEEFKCYSNPPYFPVSIPYAGVTIIFLIDYSAVPYEDLCAFLMNVALPLGDLTVRSSNLDPSS